MNYFINPPQFRTITLGVNIRACIDPKVSVFRHALFTTVMPEIKRVQGLISSTLETEGVKFDNFRLSVTPIATLHGHWGVGDYIAVADVLEELAVAVDAQFVGGFASFIENRSNTQEAFLKALPEVLLRTSRVCGFLNVASTSAGINIEAISQAVKVLRNLCNEPDSQSSLNSCARFAITCNAKPNTPYMPIGFHGDEMEDYSLDIGLGGIEFLSDVLAEADNCLPIQALAQKIRDQVSRLTQRAEVIGLKLAGSTGVALGGIDVSLVPSPRNERFSLLRLFQHIGVDTIDTPGSLAILAMLNDAVKRGALMGSSYVKGLSGTFVSVSEDSEIWQTTQQQGVSLDRLLALTAVCSVGVDMVAIPAQTSLESIGGFVADEMALGCIHGKTTSVRLILSYNEITEFSDVDLFGRVRLAEINRSDNSRLIKRGGFIPPPLHGFRN